MKPGQGLFVRDFVDDDEEDVVVESTNKEQCTYKKCLLFPLSLLPDKVIMEFADRTGQQEHYSLFGADHGTPSVLSEFGGQREDTAPQNSTSAGLESSLDLHLTDEISVIEAPNGDFDPEEIEEQDLSKADEVEDSCSEDEGESTLGSKQQKKSVDLDSSALSSEISSRQQKSLNATKQASKSREEAGEVDEGQLDQTFADNEISSFSLASKRTRMKAKPNETTTQCIGKKEYFPCPECKRPLSTASALTRHVSSGKCTPSATFNQGIVVKCPLCPKICQSSGGLVRHTKSAHADNVTLVSNTLPIRPSKAKAAQKATGASVALAGAPLARASAASKAEAAATRRATRTSTTLAEPSASLVRTTAASKTSRQKASVSLSGASSPSARASSPSARASVASAQRSTRARAVENGDKVYCFCYLCFCILTTVCAGAV